MGKDPLIGKVLHDTHKIVRLVGKGGMGEVYEAIHTRLAKKRFAIKVLHRDVAEDSQYYSRFRREAKIATDLKHPSIVEVLDFYELDNGQPCMVMEFLDGDDLGVFLKRAGRLSLEQYLPIVAQIGSALQATHAKGIVHRDLKPANIFLLESEGKLRAKLLDFGISKVRDSSTMLTQERALLGTPHYMSPEQAEGLASDVDQRTDIFALGTISYQALTGVLPFDADSMPSIFYRICKFEPKPVTDLVPDLPSRLNRVLRRAMAKKKKKRYGQVMEFVQDLELCLYSGRTLFGIPLRSPPRRPTDEILESLVAKPDTIDALATTQSGAVGEKSMDTPWQVLSRRRWPLLASAGLVTAIAAAGVFLLIDWNNAPSSQPTVTEKRRTTRPAVKAPVDVPPPVEKQPATPTPSPEPKTKEDPRKVQITLKLSPSKVRVLLDGTSRTDNPLVLEPSDKPHRLRVEADGHEPSEQDIDVRQNQTVEVTLKKLITRKPARKKGPSASMRPGIKARSLGKPKLEKKEGEKVPVKTDQAPPVKSPPDPKKKGNYVDDI